MNAKKTGFNAVLYHDDGRNILIISLGIFDNANVVIKTNQGPLIFSRSIVKHFMVAIIHLWYLS